MWTDKPWYELAIEIANKRIWKEMEEVRINLMQKPVNAEVESTRSENLDLCGKTS